VQNADLVVAQWFPPLTALVSSNERVGRSIRSRRTKDPGRMPAGCRLVLT
jgi:hypothetical protein